MVYRLARYRKYYTDYAYGDAQTGLDHAIEHLYDILPTYIPFQCLNVGSSLWYQVKDTTTKSGLILTHVNTYVCAYQNKLRAVRLYVGTENTRSDLRLRKAVDRALGIRHWSIETKRTEGRDVLFELPIPRNVERFIE